MSQISFENYAKRAALNLNYTEIAGRYSFQAEAEKNIISDIIKKLELSIDDDLLEIGCGVGNLLIPLSFMVRSTTGIDHKAVLERLTDRFNDSSIERMPGNFLDLTINQTYSKIIIYSVLQCLSNECEVTNFIKKAVTLLRPQGILLLGDIPNIDLKKRFSSTKQGQRINKEWNVQVESIPSKSLSSLEIDKRTINFNDTIVMDIVKRFRKKDLNCYIVPQPSILPFGYTREDIIIKKFAE